MLSINITSQLIDFKYFNISPFVAFLLKPKILLDKHISSERLKMQLEKYVRSMLAKEEDQEIIIPTLSEPESDRMCEDNNSLSSSEQDENSLEFQSSKSQTKSGLSVHKKIHRNRQRGNQNKLLRRNLRRNRKANSIPIHQYNSLRVMVPSIASNENASRVSQRYKLKVIRYNSVQILLEVF